MIFILHHRWLLGTTHLLVPLEYQSLIFINLSKSTNLMFETTLFSGMHHERKLLPILIHLFHHLWCKMINHLHEIIKDLNLPRRQLLPPLLSNWWIMENLSRQTQFNCNIKIQMPQIKGLHGREVQHRELPEVELRQEFLTELACPPLMKVWLLKKADLFKPSMNSPK